MATQSKISRKSHRDYSIGLIFALPLELTAATAMLDETHDDLPKKASDLNTYTLGSINDHNIVLACLPVGETGTNSAAVTARGMATTFPSIKLGLLVGIGGGIPPKVRLGDVVVSTPTGRYGGVVQWDFGKAEDEGKLRHTGSLNSPPIPLRTALTKLIRDHKMKGSKVPSYLDEMKKKYPRLAADYTWSESRKDPVSTTTGQGEQKKLKDLTVHYGLIASGNQVIKDAKKRDILNQRYDGNILCVETEAAGLMNHFPCLVIRGICDYADAQKSDDWQEYAAAVAAGFAKELLFYVQHTEVDAERPMREVLDQGQSSPTENGETRVKLQSKEDLEILDWLTKVDYGPQQSDYFKRRQLGTGEWFLQSSDFIKWLASHKSALFCHGIPGAGKTIISSMVVDLLTSRFKQPDTGIAYIYCNYQRQNEQEIEDLLSSILKQLAQHFSAIPDCIKEAYEKHKVGRTRLSLAEISAMISTLVGMHSRTFLVVDALDECQPLKGCRRRLLSELSNLLTRHDVNIFATSRVISEITDPEIMDHFQDHDYIEIRANSEDVATYLDEHVKELSPSIVRKNPELQKEITTTISQTVDGMYNLVVLFSEGFLLTVHRFLLAPLYLSLLGDKFTLNEIRETLGVLRQRDKHQDKLRKNNSLILAYEQVMRRITGQMPGMKDLALNVLMWITFAKRQLTIEELRHALATKKAQSHIDDGDLLDVVDMISVCAGLVTTDTESGIVRLVHFTTREYLMQTQSRWFACAEARIAATCAIYLSFDSFGSGPCFGDDRLSERLRFSPFYSYATLYWGHHAREDGSRIQEVIDFLTQKAKVESSSQVLMTPGESLFWDIDDFSPNTTGLHLAAFFGLVGATQALLQLTQHPNPRDSMSRTPLWYASQNGHLAVIKILVEAGCDLNAACKRGESALLAAVEGGHLDVTRMLVAAGIDVEASSDDGKRALTVAAEKGYTDIVNELLTVGAQVSAEGFRANPLLLAASKGYLGPLRSLLNAGADVNGGDAETIQKSLQLATRRGHLELVERLLSEQEVIKAVSSYSPWTPLEIAVQNGHPHIVAALLSAGADIDASNRSKVGLLFLAASRGHEEIVQALLEAGADANTRDLNSALNQASYDGSFGIVEKLLAAGAHIHATGEGIATPLQRAAMGGHRAVVEKLLEAGAGVNARYDEQAALRTLAAKDHIWAIEKMVATGTDINSPDEEERTLLQVASEKGHVKVVKRLLALGADVYADGRGDNQTALCLAIKGGWLEVVEKLLSAGANPGALSYRDRLKGARLAAAQGHLHVARGLLGREPSIGEITSFRQALQDGKQESIEAFLTEKADLKSALDEDDCSRLLVAVDEGHLAIVERLLAAGADVHSGNWHRSPIQSAVDNGHLGIVEELLAAGADVNRTDVYGKSPLFVAASNGHLAVVERLLAAGADINRMDSYGRSPLFVAINYGHLAVVERLLAAGVDTNNSKSSKHSPIRKAAYNGYLEVVERLLAAGADANALDIDAYSPLETAISQSHLDIVERLLAAGADVNHRLPILSAVSKGHLEIFERLWAAGADVEAENEEGHSPLALAACKGHQEFVERLLAAGVNVNPAISRRKFTALTLATRSGHIHIVRMLLEKGADVNYIESNGKTAVHYAAEAGYLNILEKLLSAGADVTIVDEDGCAAIHAAAREGHLEVIKRLQETNLDVNTRSENGPTPIQLACKNLHREVVRYLIAAGADDTDASIFKYPDPIESHADRTPNLENWSAEFESWFRD
ncbi:unnamed protein product [Clonostachys rosea]|uniref:Nucleoside phosphorylase domain-containing protein n=1 Tax=Bionectria ochroleuca TaxID=29856 RepID=A0ABY6UQJ4_BIOOC|nr:unnamed protein product [Clonostachys rosea]